MRPAVVTPVPLHQAFSALPSGLPRVRRVAGHDDGAPVYVTGVAIDSRLVRPGDLYIALPGAGRHGASYLAQALRAGAAAVLTDDEGMLVAADTPGAIPLFGADHLRELVGPLSAVIFNSQPTGTSRPTLFGVTGTNGKTTTTYFINSLLESLGRTTGLMGTIEIHAGGEPIASALTTPESPQVHGILSLMRERGLQTAAMEVSSHAVEYRRVDGVHFDVAGFTNLTQDHLDLHGTMEKYFAVKAALFKTERSARAVIIIDDPWGKQMAEAATADVVTLRTTDLQTGSDADQGSADWQVGDVSRDGLGHRFSLSGPAGEMLTLYSGLPGIFNISNAALATVMVLASGVSPSEVQRAADNADPFSAAVPGRMQLIGDSPAAIVDFAHNPDALARTLESVRPTAPGARLIVVFGATGQRDQTKRPLMGATAAQLADVVIVTDDDPHDEDEAAIRQGVLAGALKARDAATVPCEVLEIYPRADAIDRAVAMAAPADTVLIAGRGHEVWQEVKGVNLPLDDRVELAKALTRYGFSVHPSHRIES
ncbi:UDP-N-acetylmuramoyl-L-alanyl-D-glutamate--2,6-diaminopimelate ligase [Arthrobacter sp. H20]|uniref:UDP-N-acetylmuramoyl-L-alanyl-D-glutamate--2, 6-diaminopimelate ligase n=1 Tax=Arthrobacter sp. H20 TaxID=1267981 RepID=UPI0006865B72|nr:UDP-N-acetylmuramoyl-L-alanyl-D-glutamate--2,6-diaminopimelate ligase [Arthrobacter sp. H20]